MRCYLTIAYRIYPRWGPETEKTLRPFSDESVKANGVQKGGGYRVFLDVVLSDVEVAT